VAVAPAAFDSDPKGVFYLPQFASAAQEHFASRRAPKNRDTHRAAKNVRNTLFNWRAIQNKITKSFIVEIII
jgi:hypothetical protein